MDYMRETLIHTAGVPQKHGDVFLESLRDRGTESTRRKRDLSVDIWLLDGIGMPLCPRHQNGCVILLGDPPEDGFSLWAVHLKQPKGSLIDPTASSSGG